MRGLAQLLRAHCLELRRLADLLALLALALRVVLPALLPAQVLRLRRRVRVLGAVVVGALAAVRVDGRLLAVRVVRGTALGGVPAAVVLLLGRIRAGQLIPLGLLLAVGVLPLVPLALRVLPLVLLAVRLLTVVLLLAALRLASVGGLLLVRVAVLPFVGTLLGPLRPASVSTLVSVEGRPDATVRSRSPGHTQSSIP